VDPGVRGSRAGAGKLRVADGMDGRTSAATDEPFTDPRGTAYPVRAPAERIGADARGTA
jgi:hypothetical protein